MRGASFLSYFCAGVLLTNSVPHVVVAVTGRRNPTAFGRNSSPFVNLLWSGINVASGSLLFRFADKREHGSFPIQQDASPCRRSECSTRGSPHG